MESYAFSRSKKIDITCSTFRNPSLTKFEDNILVFFLFIMGSIGEYKKYKNMILNTGNKVTKIATVTSVCCII